MNNDNLKTYLNDHLAGSTGAIDLLHHLADSADTVPDKTFFQTLAKEVEADQQLLKEMLNSIHTEQSQLKQAAVWIAGRIGRLKLDMSDLNLGLGQFEALELLALGIQGKRLLWRILGSISTNYLMWQSYDFTDLEARAKDQLERIELRHIQLAHVTFILNSNLTNET